MSTGTTTVPPLDTAAQQMAAAQMYARIRYLQKIREAQDAFEAALEPFALEYQRAESALWNSYQATARDLWREYMADIHQAATRPPAEGTGQQPGDVTADSQDTTGTYPRTPDSHPYFDREQ